MIARAGRHHGSAVDQCWVGQAPRHHRRPEPPTDSPEQVAAARQRQSGRKGKCRKGSGAKPAGLGRCPLCKAGEMVETAKAYGCSRCSEGCEFVVWKEISGKRLTEKQINASTGKRKTPLARLLVPAAPNVTVRGHSTEKVGHNQSEPVAAARLFSFSAVGSIERLRRKFLTQSSMR